MDAFSGLAEEESVEDDFALTLHGYASLRKPGSGVSPRVGRNGPSPRKGRSGASSSKGGASAAVRFWNDVLENQLDEASGASPQAQAEETAASPTRPSLLPLLEMLDDVHFSDSEEMLEDEYLVVQPYELDAAEEVEIAPGKEDIQLEVEGEYTYGELSDGSVWCVCFTRNVAVRWF